MFQVKWDSRAWEQAAAFENAGSRWGDIMQQTSEELSKYAQEFFEPLLNVRTSPAGNGDTKRSIKPEITNHGDGFDIEYSGLLSAYYMDVGNFPAGQTLDAGAFGMKYFPVDARFGRGYKPKVIHGMGSIHSDAPSHWAEKTVKHLADDGVALDIALKHFIEFLNEVTIT